MKKDVFKIMNYNILHGFHSWDGKHKFEPNRLKLAQRIVKNEEPDILCLNEACYGGPNPYGIILDYKKLFRYKYAFFSSRKNEWGGIVLSNFPFEKVYSFTNEKFLGIRGEISIKNKLFTIDLIHPSTKVRDSIRIENMKPRLTVKENYILTGDFNSLSDEDGYDKKKTYNFIRNLGKDGEKIAKALTDMKFVKFLRKNGLVDVMKGFDGGFTVPTDLIDKVKSNPTRLDYFLTTRDVRVLNARVIRGRDVEMASDHYPIVMEVKL